MLGALLNLIRSFFRRVKRQDHPRDIETPGIAGVDTSYPTEDYTKEARSEILLAEYKEIIDTLRNWDRIIYQILTIIGSVAATLISLSVQKKEPIAWGVIFSLILFWIFTYIWQVKLAEVRIDVLIEIENELGMKGQYRRLREVKKARTFIPWFFLPFLGAFVLGPALGFVMSNSSEALEYLKLAWTYITSLFR